MRSRLSLMPALLAGLVSACDQDDGVKLVTGASTASQGALRVIDALQCPDTQGSLTRRGTARDGGSVCVYGGPRGAEVTLHLVSVPSEGPDALLRDFEQRLTRGMEPTRARLGQAVGDATASPDATSDGAAASGPGLDAQADEDQATVRMPGVSIDAKGDSARVRIGGFEVRADDGGASVNGSGAEAVSVNARDDAAEVRTRAPGLATRVTYLLTDGAATDQTWSLVGYEARGPQGGPIVVATVRSKTTGDQVFEDAKVLVSLNVGD